MNKKRIGIVIAIVAVVMVVATGLILYKQSFYAEYVPTDDEIVLHMQLDTEEDVGLLILDYLVDGHEYSGGMANADKSLLKHGSDNIYKWNKQELNTSSDTSEFSIQFRIITEYVDPNYDNIYPEEITRYIEEPVSWTAHFGESYHVIITGDKTNGYHALLESETSN